VGINTYPVVLVHINVSRETLRALT
jgi:hypothetical protein